MFILCLTHKFGFVFSWQHVMTEPFEPSPFMPSRDFDDDFDALSSRQQGPVDGNFRAPVNEKETSAKESNVAKIKVVVCYMHAIVFYISFEVGRLYNFILYFLRSYFHKG